MRGHLKLIAIFCVWAFAVLWLGHQFVDNGFLADLHAQLGGMPYADARQMSTTRNSKTAVKVLLVAYYRSGSSFTGEILHRTNNSFYAFEPLHAVEWFYLKRAMSPILMNGARWPAIIDGYQMSYVYYVLDSLLNCEFMALDQHSLQTFSKKSKLITAFKTCSGISERIQSCLQDLGAACQQAPMRIIKTIRTPMKLVGKLLGANPSLKLIHLLRDPRGHFTSWWHYDKRRTPEELAPYICNRVWEDVQERKRLEKKYPDNFMEVVYEDLAQNPINVVRNLYQWLGVGTHPNLFSWLRDSTNHAKDGSSMDTFRQNSTKTAYAWVDRISQSQLANVNKHCSSLIQYGKFPQINNVKDKFTIPSREVIFA